MPLRTDLRVGEKPIKESETEGQRMMIRRNRLSKKDQAGVTVAFFQITQDLIIGSVFLDDVDHVFERRIEFGDWRSVPVICVGDPPGVVRQSARRKTIGTYAQGAVELTQVVTQRPNKSFTGSWAIGI